MYQVLHDFQTLMLVDKIVGDSRYGIVLGRAEEAGSPRRACAPRSTWPTRDANDDPGRRAQRRRLRACCRRPDGQPLSGRDLRSLKFTGRHDAAGAAAGLDAREQRPGPAGQLGAVLGQRQQHSTPPRSPR